MKKQVAGLLKGAEGITASTAMSELGDLLSSKHVLLLVVVVDGRGLFVIKREGSWSVPVGYLEQKSRGVLWNFVGKLVPSAYFSPVSNSDKIEVLGEVDGSARIDGQCVADKFGRAIVTSIGVSYSSLKLVNGDLAHHLVRSLCELKNLMSIGRGADDNTGNILLEVAQKLIQKGSLNWGETNLAVQAGQQGVVVA